MDDAFDRSPDLCERLRRFDSPTISRAIESFGVRDRTDGFASTEIRCAYPELGALAGYAVTCTIDSTTGGAQRPSRFVDLIDTLAAAPKPSVIVVQYVGSDRARGCFMGDMSASLYRRLGAIGAITDMPNRDLPMIQYSSCSTAQTFSAACTTSRAIARGRLTIPSPSPWMRSPGRTRGPPTVTDDLISDPEVPLDQGEVHALTWNPDGRSRDAGAPIYGWAHCGIRRFQPIDEVLRFLDGVGIERAVIVQPLGDDDNGYLLEVAARHRDRLRAVSVVAADRHVGFELPTGRRARVDARPRPHPLPRIRPDGPGDPGRHRRHGT